MQKEAPFTAEEVRSLNDFQQAGIMHPFTCPSRGDGKHSCGEGMLVAAADGWHCPYCDYRQFWCHDFMADGSWRQ